MSKSLKLFLSIAFILGLVFLFGRWNKAFSLAGQTVLVPARASRFLVNRVEEGLRFIYNLPKVTAESKKLRAENLALLQLKSENQKLREENRALKNQLGVLGVAKISLLAVQVLGKIYRDGEPLLVINAGSDNSLEPGLIVVRDKFLVGEVVQTSQWSSLVRPIFSPKISVPGQLVNREGKKVLGIVQGEKRKEGRAVFSEVLIDEEISAGDLVETSGGLGRYPSSLVIGRLGEVERVENRIYQQAVIELPWEARNLGTVFVYLGKL